MPNFNRYPTSQLSQMSQIRAAYKLAGKTEPNRALEISDILENAPTVEQVTKELAKAALTAPNPQKFYADALAQIRDAQAADALRSNFKKQLEQHAHASMPEILTQAVGDLTPAVNKVIGAFVAAAKKLPTDAPLDVTANVENDSAPEYKTAKAALATLATYASLYINHPPAGVPNALAHIMPLVKLPDAVVEIVTNPLHNLTVNEHELSGTREIRALAHAAQDDLDTALIQVARGDYPSITLELATPAEHVRRRNSANVAYTQTRTENGRIVTVL